MTQPTTRRLVTEWLLHSSQSAQDTLLTSHEARVKDLESLGGLKPGDVNDATLRNILGNPASSTSIELAKQFGSKTDKGSLGVSILDFGAVGDGVTDCTAAINAAKGKGTIYFPKGVYVIKSRISLPSNTHFVGEHGTVIKAAEPWAVGGNIMFYGVPGVVGVKLENLDLDATDRAQGILWFNECTDVSILNCELHSTWIQDGAGGAGIGVQNCTRFLVKDSHINGVYTGINVWGGGDGINIIGNRIEDVDHINIRFIDDTAKMAKNIVIDGNYLDGTSHTGSLIHIGATQNALITTLYENVRVSNNTGIGQFKSFLVGGGNIDLFSLRAMRNGRVYGNVVMGGGDLGLCIEKSHDVAVYGNIVRENEISGLVIHDSHRVSVTGNVCINNSTDTGKQATLNAVRGGIRVMAGSTHVMIEGNTCMDTRVGDQKTQLYGIALWDGMQGAISQIKVGTNFVAENKWGGYYKDNAAIIINDEYSILSPTDLPKAHAPTHMTARVRNMSPGQASALVVSRSGVSVTDTALAAGGTTVTSVGVGSLSPSAMVGILLDDGTIHWSQLSGFTSPVLTLQEPVPRPAAAGNVIRFTLWRNLSVYP